MYRIRQAIVDAAQPQTQWQSANTMDPDTNHESLAQASLSWAFPGPKFTRMVKLLQSVEMDFTTFPGYLHTLQESDSLGMAAPWGNLGIIEGNGATATATHPLPGPRHFYRIGTQPVEWPPLELDLTPAVNLGSTGPAAVGKYYLATRGVPGALLGDTANTALRQLEANDGGRVIVPYLAALNPAAAFSVEIWAKPAITGTLPYNYFPNLARSEFRHRGDTPTRNGWSLYQLGPAGVINGFTFACYLGGSTASTAASVTLNTNHWNHVVGVFNQGTLSLYVDGAAVATGSVSAGQTYFPNTNWPLVFGSGLDRGWFEGDLDEAAIYTYALTAAQVQAHYQAGTNPAPPLPHQQVILNDSPAGYWRFNEP